VSPKQTADDPPAVPPGLALHSPAHRWRADRRTGRPSFQGAPGSPAQLAGIARDHADCSMPMSPRAQVTDPAAFERLSISARGMRPRPRLNRLAQQLLCRITWESQLIASTRRRCAREHEQDRDPERPRSSSRTAKPASVTSSNLREGRPDHLCRRADRELSGVRGGGRMCALSHRGPSRRPQSGPMFESRLKEPSCPP
jgi:hypothetical protein